MDKIKTRFSIADLSNLSGVPADTIRKWESRYGLLQPGRTGTNIRRYDLSNLRKLLSVASLVRSGRRISDIAGLKTGEIDSEILTTTTGMDTGHIINGFLDAMLGFDSSLFERRYKDLLAKMPFRDAYAHVIFPFLHDIGTRWQSRQVTPAHEHFISGLICQKLHAEAERNIGKVSGVTRHVLFLPLNELHEIGLLFLNCMLLRAGIKTLYLGPGMDLPELAEVRKAHEGPVTWLTWLTVSPHRWKAGTYMKRVREQVLKRGDTLLVTGSLLSGFHGTPPPQVTCFPGGGELLRSLLPSSQTQESR